MIRNLLDRLKDSDKIGIICGETKLSYKKWYELSKVLGKEVDQKMHQKIVGLFIPNSIAYAVSYFACLYANKVIAPFYTKCTMNEMLNTIKYCSISTLITTESHFLFVKSLVIKHKIPMDIMIINESAEFKKLVSFNNDSVMNTSKEDELDDVVVLLHTSGTISKQKRVMLTNKGLLSNIRSHCASLNFNDKEVCLIQLPMVFGYCNTAQFLAHVYLGACIVINPNPFLVADFYKLVEKWGVTNFTTVPTILRTLYNSDILPYDVSSLKVICFGGSPISKIHLLDIIKKFPSIAFVQTYGLTEAGPRVTTVPISHYMDKIGSVGCAISHVELRIVNDLGMTLPNGEIGEVIVKSDGVMKGYYRSAEATKAIIHDDWLYTGDLGYLSKDGYLYLCGRKKNIIISGGQNICPEEIEEVILNYPGITDVKVYGKFDELLGEIVCADIVVDSADASIIQRLIFMCSKKLSSYKIPKCFRIVKVISRTYNGKIKRFIEE